MKRLLFLSVLLVSIDAYSQDTYDVLDTIFTDIEKFETDISPEDSLYNGMHIKGAFSTTSEASALAKSEQYHEKKRHPAETQGERA